MSIEEVIKKLDEYAEYNPHKGKGGSECYVDKELLKQASIYLSDYLYCLEKESENEK